MAMFSWAFKRKLLYGGGVLLAIGIIFSLIFFKIFYKAPTCFDNEQNGDEKGVDCGGSCSLLCKNETLPPIVLWSKIFNISGDVYNAVAYVENQNINSENPKADYEFKIYNDENVLMSTRYGSVFIPKNKKFVVFESGFIFKNKKPKYAEFGFVSYSPWQKNDSEELEITVSHNPLTGTSTSPKIEGTITNQSVKNISRVELTSFIIDGKENVIAASRTFIENLLKKSKQDFVFTWPKPFVIKSESCSESVDVALVLDKSGSMRSESIDPAEPFNTVKDTAKNFINSLTDTDQSFIVSFGDDAMVENGLTKNKSISLRSIDDMFLGTTSEQTNIQKGLDTAWRELRAVKSENKKVIILLTDGLPTLPHSTTTLDYPKISAQTTAQEIISSGVEIYTIGLGNNISEGFLKNISSDAKHYFAAQEKRALSAVYKNISASMCDKKPNLITVMFRIIPE